MKSDTGIEDLVTGLCAIRNREELESWREQHVFPVESLQSILRAINPMLVKDHKAVLRVTEWLMILSEATGDQLALARATRARGVAFELINEHTKALAFLNTSVRICEDLGNEIERAKCVVNRAAIEIGLAKFDDAVADLRTAIQSFDRYGDDRLLAQCYNLMASLHVRMDRAIEGLAFFDKAESLARRVGEYKSLFSSYMNRANTLTNLDRPMDAFRYYELAADLARREGFKVGLAHCSYNVAHLYFVQGQYAKALEMIAEARTSAKVSDREHLPLCDLTESEIYLDLNMFQEAGQLAKGAYLKFEEMQTGYEAGRALSVMGVAASALGDFDKASEHFGKAKDMFKRQGNATRSAIIDVYRAIISLKSGRPEEAIELSSGACAVFIAGNYKQKAAWARLVSAQASLVRGDSETALRYALDARRMCDESFYGPLAFQLRLRLGEIHLARHETGDALRELRRACDDLDQTLAGIRSDEFRISYSKDKVAVYELLVSALPHSASAAELFEVIERAKSRTLVDLLAGNLHHLRRENDSLFASKLREVREQLDWCRRRLAEPAAQASGPDRALIEEVRQREAEYLDLVRHAPVEHRDYVSLQRVIWSSLPEIQECLPVGTALIEYFSAGDNILAIVITPKHCDVIPALCKREALQREFEYLRFQLSSQAATDRSQPSFAQRHLHRVHGLLIGPLESALGESKALVVVPHGFLHYLPFHALWTGAEYLVDRFRISYAPSANIFRAFTQRERLRSEEVLLMGVTDDRTAFIREELDGIKAVLPNAKVMTGPDVTREAVDREISSAKIFHLASHGVFRRDNPMFSSVKLHDSWLNLLDIYNLRTWASLVTLSGCGTGLNGVVAGDELLGLVRGFLYAGARSVAVSLWDVDDRTTAELMKAFYLGIANGTDKSEALRTAMRRIKDTHPHPYYWAPFVLMGSPS